MEKIELNEKTILIKTKLADLLICDFENLYDISIKEYENSIDKQVDILNILTNLNTDEIESLELTDFVKLNSFVKDIQIETINFYADEVINDFIYKNKIYRAKALPKDFKFTVKETKIMKNEINISLYNYLSKLAAIIYRDVLEDGSLNNDLSEEVLTQRIDIFKKNMPLNFITPYLLSITSYLTNDDKFSEILGQYNG